MFDVQIHSTWNIQHRTSNIEFKRIRIMARTLDIFSTAVARPMLARDADSMYWMSRYIERAEHVARLLLVNSNLLMDVGELAPTLQQRQWQSVLTVFRLDPAQLPSDGAPAVFFGPRVAQYM